MIAFVQYFQKLRVNLMDDLAIKQTVVQSYLEVCVEMSENKVINYCCFSIFATFQFIKLKKISDFSISRSQETRASIVLLTEEIERVKMILASATNRFQGHLVRITKKIVKKKKKMRKMKNLLKFYRLTTILKLSTMNCDE